MRLFYLLFIVVFLINSFPVIAQSSTESTWKDSTKIYKKDAAQYSSFLNNNYPYSPKPKNMWELGLAAGSSFILGDIKGKAHIGGAITLRKAISHTFSLRAGYFGSYNQGYPSGFQTLIGRKAFQNRTHSGALDLIASLNPNSRYRGNPKTNIYVLAGLNLIATEVYIRDPGRARAVHYDGNYRVFFGEGLGNTRSGTFGTFGGNPFPVANGRETFTLLPGASVGAGIAFKLTNRYNLGFEQRFTFTAYDYLDAVKAGTSDDAYSFSSVRLNINLGKTARRVEPLWWINGNNFVYNELNRPEHIKFPAPVLPDADGDGVTDQFDMEPNTPAGAPVDVRGVTKDTDGDGVPDYKDQELLTSLKCFPVNTDGVGTCPEAPCCKELRDRIENGQIIDPINNCGLGNLPSIRFKAGSTLLSREATSMLASAASKIKSEPTCRVKVVGYGSSSKAGQQLSWERVNRVIKYMVERQGISAERFIFSYGTSGEPNTVDLIGTTETGPNNVPAPHPNMRIK